MPGREAWPVICRSLGAQAGGAVKMRAVMQRLALALGVLAAGLLGLCATPLMAADAGLTATEHYRRQVVGLMEKTWYEYRSQRTEGVGPGWLMAAFDVNRQGQVQNARAAESIGASLALTGLTLRAIRETVLPPMPEEVASALRGEDGGRLQVACVAVVSPINPAMGVRPDGSVVPGLAREGLHLCELKDLPASPGNAAAVKAGAADGKAALPPPRARLVEEESTPRMLYVQQVRDAVDREWQLHARQAGTPPGLVNVVFYLNPKGGVENMRAAAEGRPQPVLTDLALRAIHDADIPPMPPEVASSLRAEEGGRMKLTFGIEARPDTGPLTQMMDEADKELAKRDEKARPQARKVDGSPKGRYTRLVIQAVEKKWHSYLRLRRHEVKEGGLELVFYVNRKGAVESLKVVNDKESTQALTELTLRAVKDAEIPAMPADVIPLLPKEDKGRLKIEFNVLLY